MSDDFPQVFLSYSSSDEEIVESVHQELAGMDLRVWRDAERISAGDDFVKALNAALAESDYFVLFWSAEAAKSRWVQSELNAAYVRWADEDSVLILPVLLDDTDRPELLKRIHYLDFRASVDDGMSKLRSYFGAEGFGPDKLPRRLTTGENCPDVLSTLSARELRLRLKGRISLNDIREIWMDTFDSRLEDELPGTPLGVAIGEMIIRARERRLLSDLMESICANRADVARA